MKELGKILGLAAVVAMTSVSAHALQYVDTDNIGAVLNAGNPSISGVFNIASADGDGLDTVGYDPNSESIVFAAAQFTIVDWDGGSEAVTVSLGSDAFASSSGTFGMGFSILGGVVLGNAYLDLSQDGIVAYTIQWTSGTSSFTASGASLTAFTAPKSPPTSVPDGGLTVSLLGFGLVSLGWLSRRLKQ